MLTRLAVLMLLVSPLLLAQRPATLEIAKEPHHKLLFENNDYRVFALELQPKAASLPHYHDSNYVVISLEDGLVAISDEGGLASSNKLKAGDVRALFTVGATVIRNAGEQPYRNITVELLAQGAGAVIFGNTDSNLTLMPDAQDPKATHDRWMDYGSVAVRQFQVLPGDALQAPKLDADLLLIALGDLQLQATTQNPPAGLIKKKKGEVEFIAGGLPASLTNIGPTPACWVVLQTNPRTYINPRVPRSMKPRGRIMRK
jgi:hypothetical protein